MANERRPVLVLTWVLMIGLGACSVAVPTPRASTTPNPQASRTETHPPSPTATATLTSPPTSTASPTQTLPPTLTPTWTPSPTPSPTPVPWADRIITPENVGELVERARWGRGRVLKRTTARDGQILVVQTPQGVYLYQTEPLETIRVIEQGQDFLIAPDGQLLATGDLDGVVSLWKLETGESIHHMEAEVDSAPSEFSEMMAMMGMDVPPLLALAFSPYTELLAVGYRDGKIRLWDVETGELVRVLEHTVAPMPRYLAFSPQGEFLVSASGHLGIWRLEDGALLHRIPNAGFLSDHPFSPDGTLLVTSQQAGTLLVWNFPSGTLEHRYGTGLNFARVEFSSEGDYLIINGGEQVRRIWDGKLVEPESLGLDVPPGEPRGEEAFAQGPGRDAGHFERPQGLRLLEDRTILVWGGLASQSGWWWQVLNGDWTPLTSESPWMANAAVSPDGRSVFSCTAAGLIQMSMPDQSQDVWDRCRQPGLVALSNDGRWLARSSGVVIDLVDPSEAAPVGNLRGHTREVVNLQFSPDGALLASNTDASQGGVELILWTLDPPTRLYTLNVPSFGVSSAVFSQDNQMFATGGGDDRVRLWRVEDGWLLKIIRLSRGATSMAFSPQGDLLAVGQWDGSLQVFSVPSGQELARLTGHPDRIVDVQFTPEGDNLITLSTDGTVRLWGVP